ncbi:hypothetical protein XA68_14509 [Ophiocordyceps unilateralis]|uniref:Uncharacterized protein n=1 Tax=Ophiocordyceps unilateralis TaxID=268505 RepID=A0A2A9PMY1_OPHUN|nr:hypothetical protein XA68_14509 [Ophiocordyceps unilateralis]
MPIPPIRPAALRLLRLPLRRNASGNGHESQKYSNANGNPVPDSLSGEGGAKGRTGGGPPLSSTAPDAPSPPKVLNSRVAGVDAARELSPEQRREVDEHNQAFEKKHDRGHIAPEYDVDKKFWKPKD